MPDVTALQILDTAVKIGLGALISGIATYFLTRSAHREEARSERRKRRYDAVERVADLVEDFTHVALKFWAAASDIVTKSHSPNRDEWKERLGELQQELFHAFGDLSRAEGALLLLREKKAQALVRDYGEFIVGEIGPLNNTVFDTSVEQMLALRKGLLDRRASFFDELGDAYSRTGA